jgi:hypothetical protein
LSESRGRDGDSGVPHHTICKFYQIGFFYTSKSFFLSRYLHFFLFRALVATPASCVDTGVHTPPTDQGIPPKPSECRKCRMAFPSRNQLHRHVLATGHNVQAAWDVIESTLYTRDGTDLNTLASFHYAKSEFLLSEQDLRAWMSCVDSGYGNSAVDKLFLETRVERPVIRDQELPVLVRGIRGAKVACKQVECVTPLSDTTCFRTRRAFGHLALAHAGQERATSRTISRQPEVRLLPSLKTEMLR